MFNKITERFKSLKNNRRMTLESRAEYISLDVDLFLLFMSAFYTIYFIAKGVWPLAIVAAITLAIYVIFLSFFEEHYDAWVISCFISVTVFTVVNTLFVGWQSGFQNFLFAEVTAFFLPIMKRDNKRNISRSFLIATFFAVVYMTLFVLFLNGVDSKLMFNIDKANRLYVVNTIATFFIMMMFCFVYSTHSERRLHELSRRADFDELTKIYNRYSINQILGDLIEEYEIKKRPFSVAILDIDFFKNVNDTYGHNSGDDVLKGISKILRKYSKSGVIVGRWGGEEFILIAPSNIDTLKFVKELDAIRKYIESGEFVSQGQRIGITISIGVEKYRDGWGPKEMVDAADKNLYRAKESGRNKIVY